MSSQPVEAENQITALYNSGVDVDYIAQAMEVDRAFVHTTLFNQCPRYRTQLLKVPGSPDKPLAEEMLDVMASIARDDRASPMVRVMAARTVRDDVLGRRDVEATTAQQATNILAELDNRLQNAAQLRTKFLQNKPQTPIIDVQSEPKGD